MAVDTTAIVTGAPSRNVPKTIEGQWQVVKPPWGRHKDTAPDNLSVTNVSQQSAHVSRIYLQLQRHNDTYCLTNYYVLMHYIVTATITSLNLYCYSKYYVFMTHIVTAPTTSLCAIL